MKWDEGDAIPLLSKMTSSKESTGAEGLFT